MHALKIENITNLKNSKQDVLIHLNIILTLDFGLDYILHEIEKYYLGFLEIDWNLFIITDKDGEILHTYSSNITSSRLIASIYKTLNTQKQSNLIEFIKTAKNGDFISDKNLLNTEKERSILSSNLMVSCAAASSGTRLITIMSNRKNEGFSRSTFEEVKSINNLLSHSRLRWKNNYNYTPIIRKSARFIFCGGEIRPINGNIKLLQRLILVPNFSLEDKFSDQDFSTIDEKIIQNNWGKFSIKKSSFYLNNTPAFLFTIDQYESFEAHTVHSLKELTLSPQQIKILWYLMQGVSRKGVSSILGISENTTHTVLKRIYKKLCIESLEDLFVMLFKAPSNDGAP
jgi:DNA-binding CsgD family transcriptional regulator